MAGGARAICLVAALTCGLAGSATAQTMPAGFTDSVVAAVAAPTALAFTPDGRLLVTSQPGRLRVHETGSLLPAPALDLSDRICADAERGLLGVAVDPAFASNSFVYLYYTAAGGGACVNRVSRFTLSAANSIQLATELVLIDRIPSPSGYHDGGDLHFGNDGFLYASVGDGHCDYAGDSGCGGENDAARDEHVLLGKILRVTPGGEIPPTNPNQGADSARCNITGATTPGLKCRETYAWGFRNPFRFAFDPNDPETRFFVNDVGQDLWEEIDEVRPGADYGWNVREGHCRMGSPFDCGPPPLGMTNPVHAYGREAGCKVITGGAFVPNGAWPAEYDGDYLFSDFGCGAITRLQPLATGGYAPTAFVTGLGARSAVAMKFGPSGGSQALYYTTYVGGGQIRKITYTSGGSPPSGRGVKLDAIRYAGNSRLNGEWVRLRNTGSRPVAVTGWTLRDGDGHVYRFGRLALRPDRAVLVHTGRGRSRSGHRYWNKGAGVWDDRGERAVLRSGNGMLVDTCRYRPVRSGLTSCQT